MQAVTVINKVRVLGSGPHTSTQIFWEYHPLPRDKTDILIPRGCDPSGLRSKKSKGEPALITAVTLPMHDQKLLSKLNTDAQSQTRIRIFDSSFLFCLEHWVFSHLTG